MKRGIYLQLVAGPIFTFKIEMALEEPGQNNSGLLSPTGFTPNGALNGRTEGGRKTEGPFFNRKDNNLRPETIPCDDPDEEPGFDNVWCNFRCSGCHRLIGGARNAVIAYGLGFSRMQQSKSGSVALPKFYQTPFPVNVGNDFPNFFDETCWAGISCLQLILEQLGGIEIAPSKAHWSEHQRQVLGWAAEQR